MQSVGLQYMFVGNSLYDNEFNLTFILGMQQCHINSQL